MGVERVMTRGIILVYDIIAKNRTLENFLELGIKLKGARDQTKTKYSEKWEKSMRVSIYPVFHTP